jgi:hypothetical protein
MLAHWIQQVVDDSALPGFDLGAKADADGGFDLNPNPSSD